LAWSVMKNKFKEFYDMVGDIDTAMFTTGGATAAWYHGRWQTRPPRQERTCGLVT